MLFGMVFWRFWRPSEALLGGSWEGLGGPRVAGAAHGASELRLEGVLEGLGGVLRPTRVVLEGSWSVLKAFRELWGRPGPSFQRVQGRFWKVFGSFFEGGSENRELVKMLIFLREN